MKVVPVDDDVALAALQVFGVRSLDELTMLFDKVASEVARSVGKPLSDVVVRLLPVIDRRLFWDGQKVVESVVHGKFVSHGSEPGEIQIAIGPGMSTALVVELVHAIEPQLGEKKAHVLAESVIRWLKWERGRL